MSSPSYNFGACSNPGIIYDESQYSFIPSNTDAFPFSSSLDIATLESDICKRLRQDECEASRNAINACDRARWSFSGYSGQQAADAWNQALGLDGGPSGGGALSATTGTYSSAVPSSSFVVHVSSTTALTSKSLSTSSETSSSEESTSSHTKTTSTTTIVRPTKAAESSTTASSSSTPTRTASSIPQTTNDSSNGSPFGYQNGSSSSPRKPGRTVLELMTVLLLFVPLI